MIPSVFQGTMILMVLDIFYHESISWADTKNPNVVWRYTMSNEDWVQQFVFRIFYVLQVVYFDQGMKAV